MALLVGDHLDSMFGPAQEAIGLDQLVANRLLGLTDGGKRTKRRTGAGDAQFWHPAAPYQLLSLRVELDLANAAATNLDVVAQQRDHLMPLMGIDLPLDRMNILDGGEIQVLAPDERPQAREEEVAGFEIAGDGPGLDHGRPLPILAQSLVVGFGGARGDGEGCRTRIRSEPEVDPQHIAVGRSLAQERH